MTRTQCMDKKIKEAELQLSLDDRQDCSSSSVLITKEETEQFYEVLQSISVPLVASGNFWLLWDHKATKNHLATLQPSSHGKFLIFLKRLYSEEQLCPMFQLHREGK